MLKRLQLLRGPQGSGICHNLILVFLLLLSGVQASDNFLKKPFFSHREIIVISDTGFSSIVEVDGDTKNSGTGLSFPVSSLSAIGDYQAFQMKKAKWQKLKGLQFSQEAQPPGREFFDESVFMARFNLPGEMRFDIRYTTFCRELMLLDFLSFNSLMADTTEYTITVPRSQVFFFHADYVQYLHSFSVDSLVNESGITYRFRVTAPQVEMKWSVNHMFSSGIVRPHIPGIRLVIVPAAFRNNPAGYLNDWYVRHLETRIIPNENSARLIDSITGFTRDPDSVVARLLAFANDKIRYINVYHGMESIIPKNVNQILDMRMGDCKDKANFLCQALVHKGFDTRLAVCSTRDHPFDMDFPSFAGGNHMVCIMKKPGNSSWDVLDPTNQNACPSRPGSMIETRTLFVFGKSEDSPFFYKVPVGTGNSSSITIRLEEEKETFTGTMKLVLRGYSGDFLRTALRDFGRVNHARVFGDFLQELSGGLQYTGIFYKVLPDSVVIRCGISIPASALSRMGAKTYIPMRLFPLLHRNYPEAGSGDLLVAYPVSDSVDIEMVFALPLKQAKLGATGIQGDPGFSIRHEISGRSLSLQYNFRISNTDISPGLQKHFYDCISSVSKSFDDVLIAERAD